MLAFMKTVHKPGYFSIHHSNGAEGKSYSWQIATRLINKIMLNYKLKLLYPLLLFRSSVNLHVISFQIYLL